MSTQLVTFTTCFGNENQNLIFTFSLTEKFNLDLFRTSIV